MEQLVTIIRETLSDDGCLISLKAEKLIQCKDCKHYNAGFECLKDGYGIEYPQDYFCGSAERREDG